MSFTYNPPAAPLELDGAEAEETAQLLQARRCDTLAKLRTLDPGATWRDVLLGPRRDQQNRLVQAMTKAQIPFQIVERVANCCKHAYVYENNHTRQLRIRHYSCHNRFCLICQRAYLRRIREIALSSTPEALRRLSFLTLTQRAEAGRGLREALGNILHAFRTLRRQRVWKEKVVGGLYVVDITRGSRQWWHVHLHAILDTGYWPLSQLTKAWRKAASDDVFCHISVIKGNCEKSSRNYLNKYLSKPFDNELYQHPDALADFIASTRGRQLIQPFGGWRSSAPGRTARDKVKLTRADPEDWRIVGELHELIDAAEHGSLRAARYLRKLGFDAIQLRIGAQSEVDRFWEVRAKAARPPPLFSRPAA